VRLSLPQVGERVSVYWAAEKRCFDGVVMRSSAERMHVAYDDGDKGCAKRIGTRFEACTSSSEDDKPTLPRTGSKIAGGETIVILSDDDGTPADAVATRHSVGRTKRTRAPAAELDVALAVTAAGRSSKQKRSKPAETAAAPAAAAARGLWPCEPCCADGRAAAMFPMAFGANVWRSLKADSLALDQVSLELKPSTKCAAAEGDVLLLFEAPVGLRGLARVGRRDSAASPTIALSQARACLRRRGHTAQPALRQATLLSGACTVQPQPLGGVGRARLRFERRSQRLRSDVRIPNSESEAKTVDCCTG
jgi:hypothetical protein